MPSTQAVNFFQQKAGTKTAMLTFPRIINVAMHEVQVGQRNPVLQGGKMAT